MRSFIIVLSPNNIRKIKSSRMRWLEHVARMGRREMYTILVGEPEGRDLGVDGRMG
jgi:hypothetical protein